MSASAVRRQAGRNAKSQSLTDRVYSHLKSRIISGKLGPGSFLDANGLALEMEVSKTPVREAILRLENEGAVRVDARRGIVVLPLTADDLQAFYQVITALEVEAVHRLTSEKPTTGILAPLFEQIDRMRQAADNGDGEGWNFADEAFHRALLDLCGNARLAEAGHSYRDKAQRAHFVALRLVPIETKQQSVEAHADLIRVIEAGDADLALRTHRQQRQRGAKLLVEALRKLKLEHL